MTETQRKEIMAEERSQTEQAMELLAKIIDVTNASGKTPHNHIIDLQVIDRKGCKDVLGQPKRDGLFVRPIWSDNPERSDGYYDICIDGDSSWGAVVDVFKNLSKIF